MELTTKWCATHSSVVVAPDDDPDDYWLCAVSNVTGDRAACQVVTAEVSWPSQ